MLCIWNTSSSQCNIIWVKLRKINILNVFYIFRTFYKYIAQLSYLIYKIFVMWKISCRIYWEIFSSLCAATRVQFQKCLLDWIAWKGQNEKHRQAQPKINVLWEKQIHQFFYSLNCRAADAAPRRHTATSVADALRQASRRI